MSIRATFLAAALVLPICAHAGFVEFAFTLTKPLVHNSEVLGGSTTPIVFTFRVDTDAPDLAYPVPTNSLYPINDHGAGGFGAVSLGSETAQLYGGSWSMQISPTGAGMTAVVNGPSSQFAGRALFFASVHIFDFNGHMFDNLLLPSDDNFGAYANFGMFRLGFVPEPVDVEYGTGNWVYFDAFPVDARDFTVTRTVVAAAPEPASLLLVGLALVGLVVARSRRLFSTASSRLTVRR